MTSNVNIFSRFDSFTQSAENIAELVERATDEPVSIISLTNSRTISTFSELFNQGDDSLKITCFAGVIFGDHQSLLARINSDLILLNSEEDYNEYKKLGKELSFPTDNAMCFGFPSLIGVPKKVVMKGDTICFFEQILYPETVRERVYLLNQMVEIAKVYPDRRVLIKTRSAIKGKTLHKQFGNLEEIKKRYRIDFPVNLEFTIAPVSEVLTHTSLCITISSTVAIEAMARGGDVAIISDFGCNKVIGTSNFVGSGCLISFEELRSKKIPKINDDWLALKVKQPDESEFKSALRQVLKVKRRRSLLSCGIPLIKKENSILRKTKKLFTDPSLFLKDLRVLKEFK